MRLSQILDKKTLTIKQLAKLHNVSVEELYKQLDKGIKIEREHTSHDNVAMEIALDHLKEFPDYYDRLEKTEK